MTTRPAPKRVLILGGTGEAARLAERLHEDPRLSVITSLAGRTTAPKALAGAVRSGGFGGPQALADYLRGEAVDLVVDATHPYAARVSANAAAACDAAGVPRLLLARPPWRRQSGDRWIQVPDAQGAAAAVAGLGRRAFLTIGRQELDAFAPLANTWFLVRLVEPPAEPLPLADHQVMLGRGPFSAEEDTALLRDHGIEAVVSKNSGGPGTYGKIEAARRLDLPVIMIARPALPESETVETVDAAVAWVAAHLD